MHRRQSWTSCYPPGPVPWPVLGNLLQVDLNNMPYSLYKLQNRYGDVFSLQMAWKPMVVINRMKAMKEVLLTCGEDTADRPPVPIFEHLGFKPRSQGMIFAPYGPEWREQRRFSLSSLRNFGLGRKSLEEWVIKEAGHLCDAFTTQAGQYINPNTMLKKATCNVIASLIFARRFEYEDPYLIRMLKVLEDSLTELSGLIPEVINTFPILLHIPRLADKFLQSQKSFIAIVDNLLTENRTTWDPAQSPRNLTDAFLAEIEKAKGNPESSFNDENLRMVVIDLFTAGILTTSTTLSWALLLMILHPDVQRRVQQEIDEVIGQVRHPEMADQAHMPYTNAVIHEVQRFGDIVPLHLPRITSRDIEVQDFLIPKGTILLPNMSSVHMDDTVWEKPLRFHPEHFLDAQGHFVKHEAFITFSAGRRSCLGEPLARMELFLFFTCLLQRFSFSVPDGQPQPSDHRVFSIMVAPSPYQLCAVIREQGH
ncbi:cytochrome P450, family 2, subfamily d, polypeptide 12 isoform X1 [Mus musculus]|nr:cytochrome P450, family 2, subfamily d, polypeptide 12 isoform X1 [Mus musculus]|eukprot:XP_006521191.1 PREDICTED: cytochrome P450, family 2, subfamily d, polypeptide 12 isoform X1 [Mus musculus]